MSACFAAYTTRLPDTLGLLDCLDSCLSGKSINDYLLRSRSEGDVAGADLVETRLVGLGLGLGTRVGLSWERERIGSMSFRARGRGAVSTECECLVSLGIMMPCISRSAILVEAWIATCKLCHYRCTLEVDAIFPLDPEMIQASLLCSVHT